MKRGRFGWKVGAVLISILSLASFAGSALKGSTLLSSAGLVFASTGMIQYAFGWPKFPRSLWRVFGPIFSILMIWSLARGIGWLGTRLVVRQLTPGAQAATVGALIMTAAFGAIVFVPLYRLCEWKHFKQKAQTAEAAALQDTFA